MICIGSSNANIYCITKWSSCRFVAIDSRGWRSKRVSYRWSKSIMDSRPNGPRSHCTNPIEKWCSRRCCSVCKLCFYFVNKFMNNHYFTFTNHRMERPLYSKQLTKDFQLSYMNFWNTNQICICCRYSY